MHKQKHYQGPFIKCVRKIYQKSQHFYSLIPTRTYTYFLDDSLRCVTHIVFFERKPDINFFALVIDVYWCLWWLWFIGVYVFDKKIPPACNNVQKDNQSQTAFSKLPKCTHLLKNIPECLYRIYITKLHRLADNTLSVMFCVVKTVSISKQTQKDLMQPLRRYSQQKIHITTKSPHIMKRTKLLIFKCFCALYMKRLAG